MKFLISERKISPLRSILDNARINKSHRGLSVVGRVPCASWPIFRARGIDQLESSRLFERRCETRRDASHVARNGPRHGREFYRKPISAFPSIIRSSVRSTYLHGYGVLFEIALSRIMQYFSFYRGRRKGRHVREAVEGIGSREWSRGPSRLRSILFAGEFQQFPSLIQHKLLHHQ